MPGDTSASERRLNNARHFRERLTEAIERAGINRATLAERAELDRSTLSQLLTSDQSRLPRADTVASLAAVLQVSVDWLLGLSADIRRGAEILEESLRIEPHDMSPADENMRRWHDESVGYKIRYVPSTIPDLAKTEAVLAHEYSSETSKSPDQARRASENRLKYSRSPDTDMEICMPRQTLEGLARGEGNWRELADDVRIEQLENLRSIFSELYPRLRLYLFDNLSYYSVPYTVFGSRRAVIFCGQMYFVFNTRGHVQVLSRHFDDLIRGSVVHAHDTSDFIEELLSQTWH